MPGSSFLSSAARNRAAAALLRLAQHLNPNAFSLHREDPETDQRPIPTTVTGWPVGRGPNRRRIGGTTHA